MSTKPFPFSACKECVSPGGGGSNITVDSELSGTSENPVQNKVVTEMLEKKVDYDVAHYSKINSLKTGVLYKIQQPTPNIPEYFIFAVPDSMGVVQYKISNSGISIRRSGAAYGGEPIPWTEWEDVIFSSDIEKLEPFVVEATLTKSQIPESEGGGFDYSVSSSVTAEEVQAARINGQNLVLRLTDDKGYSTYSPVYYWIENYSLVQWYVHYEGGLLEVFFADILGDGHPFWVVDFWNYTTKSYVDDAIEKVEPFVVNITLTDNGDGSLKVSGDVNADELKTAHLSKRRIILNGTDHHGNEFTVSDYEYVSNYGSNDMFSFCWYWHNMQNARLYTIPYHNTVSGILGVGWGLVVPVSLATEQYVQEQIGDIETSLENIIAKYGLGGDSV